MKVKLNTGIPDDSRVKICSELNHILADVYVTFVQARNFHWNIVGSQFQPFHGKFQEIYELMDNTGDELAERVRALDGVPVATMSEWLAEAELKEVSSTQKVLSGTEMVVVLVSDLEHIVSDMRELCDNDDEDTETPEEEAAEYDCDEATETMLGAQMLEIEKQVWMLRSFLA
jgi:starvation-inducible DNA-binding protein